ncbi:hypothetical protein H0H92_008781 [Tricholoma furcatifolium]|nr:hypothetical protein H0H92_008781 [Tricholoma furcatifolium]
MRFSSALLAVLISLLVVAASQSHDSRDALAARHSRISARLAASEDNVKRKRCKPKDHAPSVRVLSLSLSPSQFFTDLGRQSTKKETTSTKASTTKTTASSKATASSTASSTTIEGLLSVPSNCGAIGATEDVTHTTGPNGNIDWLNCGVTGSGWNPPFVKVSEIISVSLSASVNSGKGPFLACSAYVDYFEQYGSEFGIPAIMLASFAMQESSCNPNTVGGAGEQGLMQITKDKCGGAPDGNCRDPDFNIRTGAKFFAQTLSDNGGDLLLSVGNYNGWFKGMTYADATADAKTSCCRCQQNLD